MWLEVYFIISRDQLLGRNIDKSKLWTSGNLQLVGAAPEDREERDKFFESHNPTEKNKPGQEDVQLVQKIATDSLRIDGEIRKALGTLNKTKDK